MKSARRAVLTLTLVVVAITPVSGADPEPSYLKDRGRGVATSMFGTYIRRGELIVYPFFEYYLDNNLEYEPADFGRGPAQEFRGRYRAKEGLVLLGYGLGENVALELEAAVIKASLEKSPADLSAMPARLDESGLGDVEAQLRWRWRQEDDERPELFSYAEVVFPHHRDKPLIGTSGWELKLGMGVTRGFGWGTLTGRLAVEHASGPAGHALELGEYAIEYLKRVSPRWRFYAGLEGAQDELSLIVEAQWHLSRNVFVKLNNGLGITSKATDWAPEIGVVFVLPARHNQRP